MIHPYLHFDFTNNDGNITQHTFKNPRKIYQANKPEDVQPIFEKIERDIESGYYIAGYVSYEAAPAFDGKYQVHSNSTIPLVWFGVFEELSTPYTSENRDNYQVSNWSSTSNFFQYQEGINQIKHAIEAGNTYQVNYTARLQADFTGDDYNFYQQLKKNQQASYSAYLNIGHHRILSASPELFFRISDGKITTKPMKGTINRGRYSAEDNYFQNILSQSEKEQAENLMIVDLLRNDLGRIAQPGSIKVPKLFEVESYPTVHQMTSTIEANLEPDITVFDWFQALFPCGSITGAPKIRTMEYIAQLEQSPRDVYCGAIGFITPKREAIFNVPIRTVLIDSVTNTATYGVGGGITWDSTITGEYQELITKAKMLTEKRLPFDLLESILLKDGEYPLLPYHVARLKDSANYFNYSVNTEAILCYLDDLSRTNPNGSFKIRLLLGETGDINATMNPIEEKPQYAITCCLAKNPVDKQHVFLFHKTTNRTIYEEHQAIKPDEAFSVLLWNEAEQLTEFTIGNLVVEQNGKFYTPPINCGLLAGTFRQKLLDEKVVSEKILLKKDLSTFDSIWFINSVRGWIRVNIT